MNPPPAPRFNLRWRTREVAIVLAVCAAGLVLLAVRYAARPLAVPEQVPVDPVRSQAATERINPNTASIGSLQRLPGIGQVKAQAILDYRRAHGPQAFRCPADLATVKGIGPTTVEHLAPFLVFPTTAPTTATATAPAPK